jgi:hypothetical protein
MKVPSSPQWFGAVALVFGCGALGRLTACGEHGSLSLRVNGADQGYPGGARREDPKRDIGEPVEQVDIAKLQWSGWRAASAERSRSTAERLRSHVEDQRAAHQDESKARRDESNQDGAREDRKNSE